MQRNRLVLFVCFLAATLAACGDQQSPTEPAASSRSPHNRTVAPPASSGTTVQNTAASCTSGNWIGTMGSGNEVCIPAQP
jgi:ABC-type Fe3+-hydroxamate transport system substrate-binding protein